MDIHVLELFCGIVETGSFSKAAKAAYLTQPTVSGHIKKLEGEAGVRLLDRLGHRATPTKAGNLLYRYAKRILALRQEAQQALDELKGGLKGELMLGASSIPGGYLLPPLIGRFRAQYPDISVVLKVSDSKEIIEAVIDGAYEVGAVGAQFDDGRLEYQKFAEDEMVLVVPPTHPWASRSSVKASELPTQPFLIRERGSGTRKIMEQALEQHNLSMGAFRVIGEMGSNEAIRQAVKTGGGIAIISRLAVASDIRHHELNAIPVAGLKLTREFYLITHRHRSRSPICNAFLKFIGAPAPPHASPHL
ncbi:LysR family transcriptional regulator [Candidatus Methylomirabilis limnetica]|jgi:DNA-binding transcriptional LysR family regulator|uniref:LysR family transcriptional regulator n=1 Tax=Candidatus Methylomirabilis limnetica TaxID=2033718 RepID=A0A2T4U137_9BACT|nr:selenium metabolism-associated LysR family transcriptional regulator [Candidatus Methylomirabilis limnetica]PTL37084.1 LysR family transcriptional regulator [Candidatus Methylomirabilis limnetica]